jgi:hypothetical protein
MVGWINLHIERHVQPIISVDGKVLKGAKASKQAHLVIQTVHSFRGEQRFMRLHVAQTTTCQDEDGTEYCSNSQVVKPHDKWLDKLLWSLLSLSAIWDVQASQQGTRAMGETKVQVPSTT